MSRVPKISRRQERQVERTKEHFELRYESTVNFESYWTPVALVGPPRAGLRMFQFLVRPADPRNAEAVSDVKNKI